MNQDRIHSLYFQETYLGGKNCVETFSRAQIKVYHGDEVELYPG